MFPAWRTFICKVDGNDDGFSLALSLISRDRPAPRALAEGFATAPDPLAFGLLSPLEAVRENRSDSDRQQDKSGVANGAQRYRTPMRVAALAIVSEGEVVPGEVNRPR